MKNLVQSFMPLLLMVLLVSCDKTVTGRVTLTGSMPRVNLVLVVDDTRHVRIVGACADLIQSRYRGQIITVKGTFIRDENYAGPMPTLEVTEILSVGR